jgi:transcriptional regulator with XRE-family HTH domain
VLGAYERGERAISVQRLYGLAGLYDVDISHLIPIGEEAADSSVTIDLEAMAAADEQMSEAIDRVLVAIQMRRRNGAGDLAVRKADLELLAALVRSDRTTTPQVHTDPE